MFSWFLAKHFLQIWSNNLVWTKPSCLRCHAIACSKPNFFNFLCVSNREKAPPPPMLPQLLLIWQLTGWMFPWGKEPLLLAHISDRKSEDWGEVIHQIWQDPNRPTWHHQNLNYSDNVILFGGAEWSKSLLCSEVSDIKSVVSIDGRTHLLKQQL